jgi:peroxiredoxin
MRVTTKISGIVLTTLVMFLSCGNQRADSSTIADTDSTMASLQTGDLLQAAGEGVDGKAINFKGKLEGASNALVLISRLTTTKLEFADSTRTDNQGNFTFNTNLSNEDLYFITVGKAQPPGVPVVLGPGTKISLTMSQGDYIETTVKGNKVNKELKELYDLYIAHNLISAKFNQRVSSVDPQTASQAQRDAIQTEYAQIQANLLTDLEKFVSEHEGSLVSYFAATFIIPKTPISLTEKAVAQMKKDVPTLAQTRELDERLNSIRPLDIGGMAPEIALNSPEGEVIKLSSLKGKVVLIDFWASWCGPCRRENPNVVRAYNKYKDKGFEIYGVSLDKDGSKWKYAIQKDGITWIQVSDLKGWSNVAAKRYKVSSIPQTVLLGRDGRIIAKNLRGAALDAKLAEVLGG